jgi:hypothetical protein
LPRSKTLNKPAAQLNTWRKKLSRENARLAVTLTA